MKSGDSRSLGGLVLPLQAFDPRFKPEERSSVLAYRVLGRQDGKDQTGAWLIDDKAIGDVWGGYFWPSNPTRRVTGAWTFAWPVKVTSTLAAAEVVPLIPTGDPRGEDIPFAAMVAGCPPSSGPFSVQPLYNRDLKADEAFLPIQIQDPPSSKFKPRYPAGTLGTLLSPTRQAENFAGDGYAQEEIFLHGDPRLVAPNRGGAADMGSEVFDLTPTAEYDYDHRARLQSVWRVTVPEGRWKEPVLAWQIGAKAGCGCDAPGFVWGPAGAKYAIGAVSEVDGGPFSVGNYVDRHNLGKTKDGDPMNSLHLSTLSLFTDHTRDGPQEFQKVPYERPKELKYKSRVHERFDDVTQQWRWLAEVPLYTVGPTPYTPDPVRTPDVPTPGTGSTPPGTPGRIGPDPGPGGTPTGRATGSVGVPGSPPSPFIPTYDPNFPLVMPDRYQEQGGNIPPFQVARPIASESYTSLVENFGVSGLLYRARLMGSALLDLTNPNNVTPATIAEFDRTAPVVMRMEASARQEANSTQIGSGAYNTNQIKGAFKYTVKPNVSQFPGGTAGGVIGLMAPEIRMADYANMSPAGIGGTATQSTSYFSAISNTGSGVFFASGQPDLALGTILLGYSWGVDTTGNLIFRIHDTANNVDASQQIRFNTVGDIAFKSSTSFWGEFQHAITAARTWTLPDASGTLGFGTITGTGTAIQLAYWDGTTSITGNAAFNVDAANQTILIGSATNRGGAVRLGLEDPTNDSCAFYLWNGASALDNRMWFFVASGTTYKIRALDDTGASGATPLSITRSGTTATNFDIAATTVKVTGNLVAPDATHDIGASLATRFRDCFLSSRIVVGDGTVSLPSMTFGSDLNSGWFSLYADAVALTLGGTRQVSFQQGSGTVLEESILSFASSSGGAIDLILLRDGANVLAQRNGTNAQTNRIYGTWTSATNYERLALGYVGASTDFEILTEKGSGGGTARPLTFGTDATRWWQISTTGQLLALAANLDIGASGANRPNDLYLAGAVKQGAWQATAVAILYGGTGQTTALAAFNALSPVTTRGDLIYRDATTNARLPLGGVGTYIRSDGTDAGWSSFICENLTSDPASPATGQVWLRTDL